MKINKMLWTCSTCKKVQKGGNRYANPKLKGHECKDCTPYLKP